jgi:hypothetical protein
MDGARVSLNQACFPFCQLGFSMAITSDDLHAFHQFAQAQVASDGAQNLHQLVDLWEIDHPSPDDYAHDLAAVQAALRDMESGDTGRPANELVKELRVELAARRNQ